MADRVITVSELRCACLDADWRARWLAGAKPSTRTYAPPGAVASQGAAFHRLAEHFTEWLLSAGQLAAELDAEGLWIALHDHYAGKKLRQLAGEGKLPSAHHLSRALRSFCEALADLRKRTPDFRSWQDIFLTHEFAVDRVPLPVAGGGTVLVSGRPDAV
ncbi:MAG: cell division protein FtsK, partial [Chthoniobacteraceae bacterium]